jgi:hypothetical protein
MEETQRVCVRTFLKDTEEGSVQVPMSPDDKRCLLKSMTAFDVTQVNALFAKTMQQKEAADAANKADPAAAIAAAEITPFPAEHVVKEKAMSRSELRRWKDAGMYVVRFRVSFWYSHLVII